ncbi:MAG: spore germination protein [Firmicutes bacterium]|nr:spore germination protein [Bacillota bacterium]
MKKISTRQVIIFFCIYFFSIKFLSLPGLLSGGAGRDAWIVALIGTVLELLVLFLVLNVLVIGKDSDIYSDFRSNAKGIGAKFMISLMFSLFMLQLFILMRSSHLLLNEHLFNGTMNIHKFLVPLMIFGICFCFVPARAIFRSGEIFYIFILLALALSIFPALSQMRPSEITPMFENGASPIFRTLYHNLIYFESASFLFIFSGDIKIEKNFRRNFMITAGIVGLFFVFFVFMFTSLFGPIAELKNVAIINLTVHSTFLTQSGRLDWILICVWLLLLLIRFGVTFYASFACVRYLFNIKHRAGYIGFGIAVALYLLYYFIFCGDTLDRFIRIIAPGIVALFLFIPLAFFVNSLILKKRGTKNV